MDNVKENSTPAEKPLDLYEEFAHLCGAPADMDRDGQIELFGQYQRDFDEMKEALFKDKTYEEQEELANTFIADWVANTKAKMADRKKKPTAPPEAYITAVRIYAQWLERDEEKKIALAEQSVNNAARLHSMYKLNKDYSQFLLKKGYTTLYGADFDDYVNEAWATFLEMCSDVDQFAEYLKEDFDKNFDKCKNMLKTNYQKRCRLQLNRIVNNFIERAEKDWKREIEKYYRDNKDKDTDKETEEGLPKKLVESLDADCEKRCAELAKIKKEFDETTAQGYPSLWLLLRRPAQNMMERLYREQQKASQGISLDADDINTDTMPEIEDKTKHGLLVENDLIVRDYIERVKKKLDKTDAQILDAKISGASQTEIANELGISNAAVSKRVNKIRAIMQNMIQ